MRKVWLAAGLGLMLAGLAACGGVVRRTTPVDIPPAYAEARTATLEELVELVNEGYGAVRSLTVTRFDVEYEGGSLDLGYYERYPRARGYLVAAWPDSIFVNILNPLTNSTVVTMAARGGQFQIWAPRDNKYLVGSVEVKLQHENPMLNIRPQHLLRAILVEEVPVGDPEYAYFLEEEQDERFKYYVLAVVRLRRDSPVLELVRRLWIERSSLRLVRQHYYEEGALTSVIRYFSPLRVEDTLVHGGVELQRAGEGYSLRFDWDRDGMRVNRPVEEEAFEVPRPPGSELVVVQDAPEG